MNRFSVYPPEWVTDVLGRRAPDLNAAMTGFATALLLAMDENTGFFLKPYQWEALLLLRGFSRQADWSSPDQGDILANKLAEHKSLYEIAGPQEVERFKVLMSHVRNLTYMRARAILAVVDATRMSEDLEGVWWSKEEFLKRKGVIKEAPAE